MKRTTAIIFGMMFIGTMVFTSCKKDYTCECTYGSLTQKFEYTKMTKKDAKAACDAQQATYYGTATCTVN